MTSGGGGLLGESARAGEREADRDQEYDAARSVGRISLLLTRRRIEAAERLQVADQIVEIAFAQPVGPNAGMADRVPFCDRDSLSFS